MKSMLRSQMYRSLRFKVGLLITLLLMTCIGSAWAAAPLKIGTIDIAPYGMLGADGKPTGIYYEIGNLIAKEAGIPAVNVLTPYARSVKDLEDGTASFVLRFTNADVDKSSIPVAEVGSIPTIILGAKGVSIKSIADLHGKTVAVLRGSINDNPIIGSDSLITKYEVNDFNQALQMLAAKRVDAAIGGTIGLYYEAHKLGLKQGQLGDAFFLSTRKNLLNYSKKNADDKTIAALKAAVERLNKQDVLNKIINKYMGDFNWSMK